MALRWRIRHKLLLGLGVVVGIIGFLLGSTLYGLAAFTATVKIAESKVTELHHAELLDQLVKAHVLKVFEDHGNRRARSAEDPGAAALAGDALHGGALRPVECGRFVGSFHAKVLTQPGRCVTSG